MKTPTIEDAQAQLRAADLFIKAGNGLAAIDALDMALDTIAKIQERVEATAAEHDERRN